MKYDPTEGIPHPQTNAAAWFFARLRQGAHRAAQHWREIITRDPCTYCNTRNRNRTREHVEPKSMGGHLHFGNVAAACHRCQIGRGNIPFLRYYVAMAVVRARGESTRRIASGEIKGRNMNGIKRVPGDSATREER